MLPIVYIAGYGRSGSTIFERILGLHPSIAITGELFQFFLMARDPTLKCSCGQCVQACEFWGNVYSDLSRGKNGPSTFEQYEELRDRVEAVSWRRALSYPTTDVKRQYAELMRRLFQAIALQLNLQSGYLVDSSKTAYCAANRPLVLQELVDLDVYLIHLVRDVRGVMWSEGGRGDNRYLETGIQSRGRLRYLRSLIGWQQANKAASRLRRRWAKGRYLLVRYEDFVLQPALEIERIGGFLGLDVGLSRGELSGEENDDPWHQLAGNRARFAKKLALTPDLEWQKKLSTPQQLLARVLAGPLMKECGYS